jgi:hypothetical protein
MDNAYALIALLAILAFLSCCVIIPIMIISRVVRAGARSMRKTARAFRK